MPISRTHVVATTAALLLLTGIAPVPAHARGNDGALREYQKAFLDPQATESRPATSGTAEHHGHHHHHATTDVRVAGVAGTQQAVAAALPASTGGQWSFLTPFPSAFNAIHAIVGPQGKVLLVAGSGYNKPDFDAGRFRSYVWVPATGVRREVATPEDLFCGGHVLLPDGRALVVGGTTGWSPWKGARSAYAFDFVAERYERLAPMEIARWYPTVVTGGDGRSLIVSGLDHRGVLTGTHEVFDYRTNTHARIPGTRQFPLYPHIFHTSVNTYFYAGVSFASSTVPPGFWSPFGGNTYRPVPGLSAPAQRAGAASCFVGDIRNQDLLVMGGGWPATASTSSIKLTAPSPAFRAGPAMRAAKAYVGCVNLPDGTLLEANGGSSNVTSRASPEVAMLTSVNGPWIGLNPLPAGQHRLYHNVLFLLDNGQVVSMTSNPSTGGRSTTLLLYSPPYLFKGTRPVFMSAPPTMTYGGSYVVSARSAPGSVVNRVTMTSASSVTHATDPNQRYISLPITNGRITIPTNRSVLPPGRYRLWAVDTVGRPSVAGWITLS